MEPTSTESTLPSKDFVGPPEPSKVVEANKPDILLVELQRSAHTIINTKAKEIVAKIDAITGDTPAQIESKKTAFFQAHPEQAALYKAYKAQTTSPEQEIELPVGIIANFEPTSPTFALVQQYIESRKPEFELTEQRKAQLKPMIEAAAAVEGIITTSQLTAIVNRYLAQQELPTDTKSPEYTAVIQDNEQRTKLKNLLTTALSQHILATPQDLETVLDLIGVNTKTIDANIASSNSILGDLNRAKANDDLSAQELADIEEGIALHKQALALYQQSAQALKDNGLPNYINKQIAGEIPAATAKAIAQSLEGGDITPLLTFISPDLPSTATVAEKEAQEKERATIKQILLHAGTGLGFLFLIGILNKARA